MMLDHEYVCCTTIVALPASRDSIPRESRWPVGVLTRILPRRYALPDGSPESLKQVFRGLLEVRPHRRVTCEELWANPWIKNERDGHPSLAPITLLATSTAITDDTIDVSGPSPPPCYQIAVANLTSRIISVSKSMALTTMSLADGDCGISSKTDWPRCADVCSIGHTESVSTLQSAFFFPVICLMRTTYSHRIPTMLWILLAGATQSVGRTTHALDTNNLFRTAQQLPCH
jgi:hypothetical protein